MIELLIQFLSLLLAFLVIVFLIFEFLWGDVFFSCFILDSESASKIIMVSFVEL